MEPEGFVLEPPSPPVLSLAAAPASLVEPLSLTSSFEAWWPLVSEWLQADNGWHRESRFAAQISPVRATYKMAKSNMGLLQKHAEDIGVAGGAVGWLCDPLKLAAVLDDQGRRRTAHSMFGLCDGAKKLLAFFHRRALVTSAIHADLRGDLEARLRLVRGLAPIYLISSFVLRLLSA